MYVSLRGTASAPAGRRGTVSRPVLALGLVSLLTDVSSEAVSAVLPLYVTVGLGASMLTYGVVDGVYQGVSTLVRLPAAWASDRLDRPKAVALVGYLVSAATRVGLVLLTGVGALLALLAVDRVGKGLRTAPRDTLITLATPGPSRGRAFGVHRAMDTLGACLGPLVAFLVLLAVPQGFGVVFVVSLAFAVVGVLALVLLVPDLRGRTSPPATTGGSAAPVPGPTTGVVLGAPVRRLLLVAGLLSLLTVGDGVLFLTLVERHDVAAGWLPLMALAVSAAYLLLAVPVGAVADRWGRLRTFVAGHLALVAAYSVALVSAGATAGVLLSLVVLGALGVYYAATDGVLAAVGGDLAEPTARATTIAAAQTVVVLGRLGASVGFGALWVWVGPGAALAVAAVALVVALPLAWRLAAGARS